MGASRPGTALERTVSLSNVQQQTPQTVTQLLPWGPRDPSGHWETNHSLLLFEALSRDPAHKPMLPATELHTRRGTQGPATGALLLKQPPNPHGRPHRDL